ncbi:hypothetical protein [Xanthomonas arboricola]|uniref:hypothetical protein n=1 Tax=Xanthomonas arboricola TaxID=56448 RepID=UPI00128EEED4|nr:hypothetical protein [Xanthomonas arboricola]
MLLRQKNIRAGGKIISVENGWQGEGVAIRHSIASIKGCAADSNDFAIDKNHPSYKELVAIALAAFTSQSDVQLVVDKGVCIFGARTKNNLDTAEEIESSFRLIDF